MYNITTMFPNIVSS